MGFAEILVILVIALLVFGPERLPTMIKEAASFVRDLRTMVAKARGDLGTSIGDLGLDQEDLKLLSELRDPKTFIRQRVLDGVDLDDPELAEALSLDDDKPRKNGAQRSKSTGTRSPQLGTDRSTESAEPATGSVSGSRTNGHPVAASDGHPVAASDGHPVAASDGHPVAASDEAAPPPFDPDTT